MPRARLLKPGFFKNPELAQLSVTHRLTYAGLWTLADREGRLEDRPNRIRIEVFPYEPKIELDPVLQDLHAAGFIRRYRVAGRKVIQIPKFLVHQTPHFKEPASELPPPRGHQDSAVVAFGVPDDQRARILARDHYRCVKCGAGDHLTIDHIVARTRGGTGDDENLEVLCKRCNSKKGNRLKGNGEGVTSTATDPPINDASMGHSSMAGSPDPVPEAEAVPRSGTRTGKSSAADAARRLPAPENPKDNLGVITKLAHDAIGALGPTSLSDLTESVKQRCAELHIAYDSLAVKKAIDSALFQRQRPVHA